MSREGRPIERRWREGVGDATDRRIAGLLRRVSDPPALADARLDRVAEALAADLPVAPRRWRRPALRWAVAALVLSSGGAVFARHQIARLWESVRPELPAAPVMAPNPAVPRPRHEVPVPIVATAPVDAPVPPLAVPTRPRVSVRTSARATPAMAPTPQPARAPLPARPDPAPSVAELDLAPVPVSPPAPARPATVLATPAAQPGLGEETRLVRQALQELRKERDARAALTTLDQHRARFAGGVLRADADLLRVEALLALDRDDEALALLERLDLAGGPRADELLMTRGELRATRDCAGAVADFERVLGGAAPAAVAERALRGRAVCLLRLGDAGGEAALRAYLARFPEGPFAGEARKRLRLVP